MVPFMLIQQVKSDRSISEHFNIRNGECNVSIIPFLFLKQLSMIMDRDCFS